MNILVLAYALILIGGLLMASELVLFAHGVLAMIGLGGIIVGTVLVFGEDRVLGIVTLLGLFVIMPLLGKMLLNYWPHSPMGKRLVLQAPPDETTNAHWPAMRELENLRGRYGKTLSPLRPAGVTDFDGRRIDSLSEGTLIEAGQWVRCVDVKAGKVIVRPTEAPPATSDLENMDLT